MLGPTLLSIILGTATTSFHASSVLSISRGGVNISTPKHFSEEFKLGITGHRDIEFIDVDLTKDVTLYIDSTLIEIVDSSWCNVMEAVIEDYFNHVLDSCILGDTKRLYELVAHASEPNETKLGLSTKKSRGKGSRPESLFNIFSSISFKRLLENETITKPSDITIFVRNFAEDRMSDLITNVIRRQLYEFTVDQCKKHHIPLEASTRDIGMYWDVESKCWKNLVASPLVVRGERLLLVPKIVVRRSYLLSAEQYISKFIVEYFQDYHVKERTDQCEIGYHKDGTQYVKPPIKKYLRSTLQSGKDNKEFLNDFAESNPEITAELQEVDITTKSYRYFVSPDQYLDEWVYKHLDQATGS